MSRLWIGALMAALALVTIACGGDDDRPLPPIGTDSGGGGGDGGGTDAGGTDAGGIDAGGIDAGGIDAGGADAGDPCDGVDCSSLDDACNTGTCNPTTGACEATPVTDGTACDDGDVCTDGDACSAGTCAAGTPVDCSAMSDMCNVGTCNATSGACEAVPVTDGTTCDDSNGCTMGDACTGGVCAGAPLDCSGMSDMCNVGVCDATSGSCVAMPMSDGTACDDANLCTTGDVCTTGTCGGSAVDCSAMSDMCNVGTCNPTTGACGPVPVTDGTTCDDANMCTSGDVCTGGTCGGATVVPAGDTCSTFVVLPNTDGLHTIMGSNACATDTQRGSCFTGTGGRELVYRLTLPAARNVRLETVPPASGQYDTALYVRSTCGSAGSEVACNDDGGAGLLSRIDATLSAGTYFVFVDGYDGLETGNFTLQLEITAPNTCGAAGTLAFPAAGATTTVRGSTVGAMNSFTSTCGSSANSPDHVYEFTVPAGGNWVRLETITPPSGAYDTVLHLRGLCTGATIECDDDSGSGFRSRIIRFLPAGTYHVIVDGWGSSSSGTYILELEHLEGHIALIGHDYFASSAEQDEVVGNAAMLANDDSVINILEYTQYSDNTAGGEAANTRAAIDAEATSRGRTVSYTSLTNYLGLAGALTTGIDVFLVHEQELSGFPEITVRNAWRTTLINFLRRGGVVVVCTHGNDTWQVVNGAGLLTIPSDTIITSGTMTVVAPTDPVASGVLNYPRSSGTTSFPGSSGGTVVITAGAGGAPVVRHADGY